MFNFFFLKEQLFKVTNNQLPAYNLFPKTCLTQLYNFMKKKSVYRSVQ